MRSVDERAENRGRPGRHLLWTVPVGLALGLPFWAWAGLSWCGISGCSGGGFGVYTDFVGDAIACTVIAGLLLAGAIAAVPWSRSFSIRLAIALVIATAYAMAGAIITHLH
ncbi:MAG: hypothetical protein QOE16_2067 [Microbacteriaceae bacterium]|nr:hypothetical protein [Microbacteriaceae bacterium]